MSQKTNGVPSKTVPMVGRRLRVIDMLTAQLKRGNKVAKVDKKDVTIPLTDKDITRIEKELTILKARV